MPLSRNTICVTHPVKAVVNRWKNMIIIRPEKVVWSYLVQKDKYVYGNNLIAEKLNS